MLILPIIASAVASALLGKVISNAMDSKDKTTASNDPFKLKANQCSSEQKTDSVSKDQVDSSGVKGAEEDSEDKVAKSKSASGAPALAAALDSQLNQSRVNQVGTETIGAKSVVNVGGISSIVSTPASAAGKSTGTAATPSKAPSGSDNPPFKPAQSSKTGAAGGEAWLVSQGMSETGVLPDNSLTDSTPQLMALYGVDFTRPASGNDVSVIA